MEYQPLKYIYQPAGQAEANTLLLLHGTGGNENDLLPLASHFNSPINILSVRGNVLEHGMPRFFKRLGMGIFDEEDLRFRTEELKKFLIEVALKEHFDSSKIIALGYSNGANIAGAMLINFPHFLAGAILFRPMQPYQKLPIFQGSAKPILLASGKLDPTVDAQATKAYISSLENGGYLTEHIELPIGHQLTGDDIRHATSWYAKNLENGNF